MGFKMTKKTSTPVVSSAETIRSLSAANVELQKRMGDALFRVKELESGAALAAIMRDAQSSKMRDMVAGFRTEMASARYHMAMGDKEKALEAVDRALTMVDGIG
jgi:predicted phage tail protein